MSKLSIVIFGTLATLSAASHWEIANSAVSTRWYSIAVDGSGDRIFAVANDKNVYVSHDRGHSWVASTLSPVSTWLMVGTAISNNGVYGYAVSATAPTVGPPAVTNSGIIRTFDEGLNWEVAPGSAAQKFVDVATTSSGKNLFAVDASNVYKSVNHATSFTTVYTVTDSSSFTSVAVSEDSKYVYVASTTAPSNSYLYKSANWGTTWQQTAQSLTSGTAGYSDIACSKDGKYVYSASGDKFVARSSDFGASFKSVQVSTTHTYDAIATSWSGRTVYVASSEATTSDVWQSTDFGIVWHTFDTGVTVGGRWSAIGTSNDGDLSILGAYASGILYRRSDGRRALTESANLRTA